MARPWRIQFPGAIYHVISRGNNRQEVFLGDEDKRLFLDTLAAAVSRFDLHAFAFCLMDNNYRWWSNAGFGSARLGQRWERWE